MNLVSYVPLFFFAITGSIMHYPRTLNASEAQRIAQLPCEQENESESTTVSHTMDASASSE